MKTINQFLLLTLVVVSFFLLPSCVKKSSYDSLSAEKDSLLNSKVKLETEMEEYFALLNEVSENLDKIKGTEKIITVDAQNELKGNQRDKIVNDLVYVNELIETNRQKIADLEKKLKNSSINSNQLRSTITRLTSELDSAKERIEFLEKELEEKKGIIVVLDNQVNVLSQKVDNLDQSVTELQQERDKQELIIIDQESELHTAWYAVGSTKELKDHNILTSGGLFKSSKVLQDDFNKSFFVKIDTREVMTISLNTDKAKILTNHPVSSYNLVEEPAEGNKKKNIVVKITDPVEFWSLSKYLVVESK